MDFDTKWIVGMVGLPNRAKTFVSRKLARYLSWIGNDTQVFIVSQYKSELLSKVPDADDVNFFEQTKDDNTASHEAWGDLVDYINNSHGKVAIYDDNNLTRDSREDFEKFLDENLTCEYNLIWVESICDSKEVLINNFKTTRDTYEEYTDMTDEEVFEVFEEKISNLKEIYEPLELGYPIPFIKIFNMGSHVEINKVHGFTATNILRFLLSLRAYSRPIWFSRHGKSLFNVKKLIGGNSELSEDGMKYGLCLQKFFREYYETEEGKLELDNMK